MTDYMPLPIILGVTGHRDIVPERVPELERAVESQILALKRMYPNCPVLMLSSLADGADRLCARVGLRLGCTLRVPLPMERMKYEKDFDVASKREFAELLSAADEVFTVGQLEPVPDKPTRGFYYRQAGLYITQQSHVLIALWDGAETLFPDGGGTYETVCFMRRENGIIYHIPTPRTSSDSIIGKIP